MCLFFLHVTRDPIKIIKMETKNLTMNNKEVETWIVSDALENDYTPRISDTLGYSEEYMEAMQKNYPDMTMEEIIEAIEDQKSCPIRFHHCHEWISSDLIRKYLIIDKNPSYSIKKTIETPEVHGCNLIELTPELQEKSYWGRRWNRDVVSHLIDRKDYPWENKTNKLTIIGKRNHDGYYDEDLEEQVEYEYFYVITAFWWDWSSRREPKSDYWCEYDLDDMEYWMNHALIPENNEEITKLGIAPYRLTKYYEKKEAKRIDELRKFAKKEMYIQLINYLKSVVGEFDKIEDVKMWECFSTNDERINIDTQKWDLFYKSYFMIDKWNKFWFIEVSVPDISIDKDTIAEDILNKDFTKDFKIKVIKDIERDKGDIDEELVKYRKNFVKRYYKKENIKKIISSADSIDCKMEKDVEWSKNLMIKVWDKTYELIDSNLTNHTDAEFKYLVTLSYENISDFKRVEVCLDWMRWEDPESWANKRFSDYIKEKSSQWFSIPSVEVFHELLDALWEKTWLENFQDQLLLFMYLTWLDWDYRLSMDGNYRDKVKLQNLMFRSNVGNVSGGILLMKNK